MDDVPGRTSLNSTPYRSHEAIYPIVPLEEIFVLVAYDLRHISGIGRVNRTCLHNFIQNHLFSNTGKQGLRLYARLNIHF